MKESLDVVFCHLLRFALGVSQVFPYKPTEEEWQKLFKMAKQQTVQGVFFDAISRLPVEQRPPRRLTMHLSFITEAIRGKNRQMNQESARYTQLFVGQGVQCIVLKGQANARLYPDPLSRQAGDIDIWVPGGYDKVENLLLDMGLISERKGSYKVFRHISFRNENDIEIEIHHRPTESMFRNKELQEVLLAELKNSTLVLEGFYSPSIRFALIMQLQHLYYHCVNEGVGFRHFMDYFILLTHSSDDDRKFVWDKIRRFGLTKACAGIMWVLEKTFGLSRELMLCAPDEKRGLRLYKNTIIGGNFGRSDPQKKKASHSLKHWFNKRKRSLSWFFFDPLNTTLHEIRYWRDSISLIPERIKRRKLFL